MVRYEREVRARVVLACALLIFEKLRNFIENRFP